MIYQIKSNQVKFYLDTLHAGVHKFSLKRVRVY